MQDGPPDDSPGLPLSTFPDAREPLPARPRRFPRGTMERSRDELRAMISESVAAIPAPRIVVIPARSTSR